MTRYDKAISILKQASRSGSRLGLERIYELAAKLGDPQDRIRTIHVAGTNGKGSFSAMLSSVLKEAGMKVGFFSSPAMASVCDQFRINGEIVSKKLFSDTVLSVNDVALTMSDLPTEFEILTAAAFLMFEKENCDIAVIECGMGGDGDSTNIISKPLLSVITNVAIDHCAFLGDTVSEIAYHKAGIIKEGVPCYFGGDIEAAAEVISKEALRKGSKLYRPDTQLFSFPVTSDRLTEIIYNEHLYSVPLIGAYQRKNLINVISCVEILRSRDLSISDDALKRGLSSVRWEGRFEKLSDDPLIYFDGAHNPDGMEQLCRSISMYFRGIRPAVLIGVLADKDYRLYTKMLSPIIDIVFTVSPDNERALPSDKLAECFNEGGVRSVSCSSVEDGFSAASAYAAQKSIPLIVIGSLYLYKDIKKCAEKYLKRK